MSDSLRYLTRAEYDVKTCGAKNYDWGDARWAYINLVIAQLQKLRLTRADGILEVGCASLPLCTTSDRLDIKDFGVGAVIHDAGKTPWPGSRKYGAVVALQVFEHIQAGRRRAFFNEAIRRAGKAVILSVPYCWTRGTADHLGIDEQWMLDATGRVPETVQITSTVPMRRAVFTYRASQ